MQTFRLDKTGFPMLWVEPIDAYIHWLPITKIQIEYFLCAITESSFDATWYDTILSLNRRISPAHIRANNYWQAFLTGIIPSEAQRFTRWCGEGYEIPSLDDWFTAYKSLKAMSPKASPEMGKLRDRTQTLISNLGSASKVASRDVENEYTLADQMLMRMGVMEWVELPEHRNRWGGMGETFPDFHGDLFTPDNGNPRLPINPENKRLSYYGFRLLWRP